LGQVVPKLERWRTTAEIGEQTGESYKTVQRYIRLTHLIPPLLQKVDEGKIALSPGVELSYLDEDTQQLVMDAMEREDCTPSFSQTVRMKQLYREGQLSMELINSIMAEQKANQKEHIRISKERLQGVLPQGMSSQKTEEFILKACEYYKKYLQRQRNQER
jgi:ParB family chromosome partitioning protein